MEMIKNGKPVTSDDDLEFVKQIRAIQRKRIMVSDHRRVFSLKTPLKVRNHGGNLISGRSPLESLPQDILIRILCCVDHDDLKQLFEVSKSIKEASLIAKRVYFAFSTPSKRVPALRSFSDLESDFDDEAPNAPKQQRNCYRSRIDRKKLDDISVDLFRSPPKQQWRRSLVFSAETKV